MLRDKEMKGGGVTADIIPHGFRGSIIFVAHVHGERVRTYYGGREGSCRSRVRPRVAACGRAQAACGRVRPRVAAPWPREAA